MKRISTTTNKGDVLEQVCALFQWQWFHPELMLGKFSGGKKKKNVQLVTGLIETDVKTILSPFLVCFCNCKAIVGVRIVVYKLSILLYLNWGGTVV